MGRKKIQISRITDERNRQVTFNKRKFGVMKKAYELSVLCDCEIALIIFSSSNKLYQYASTDMDKVLLKYTEYNEPHESLTNKNIIEALNKKEHKNGACGSPESLDGDSEYQLTPRTEAKYSKIDEEFQMMMQRNQLNGSRVGMNYSLPVSVPMGGSYTEQSLLAPHTSISPRPSSSETDPGMDPHLAPPPNSFSAFLPHSPRYPSGGLLDMSNGYPNSASPLGSPSPGHSPGLTGKQGPKQMGSPSPGPGPGSGQSQIPGPRQSLRVVIPSSHQTTDQHGRGSSSSMNTPVVALQTPSLPGLAYSTQLSSFNAHDFSVSADMGLGVLSWSHTNMAHSGGLPHLAVSSSTPPPSSPLPLTIKSEPISPPRDSSHSHHGVAHLLHTTLAPHTIHHGHHGLPRPNSTGHLTPTSGSVTPTNLSSPGDPRHSSGSDYDTGPINKRARLPDNWPS